MVMYNRWGQPRRPLGRRFWLLVGSYARSSFSARCSLGRRRARAVSPAAFSSPPSVVYERILEGFLTTGGRVRRPRVVAV